jgi:hypothetical protein
VKPASLDFFRGQLERRLWRCVTLCDAVWRCDDDVDDDRFLSRWYQPRPDISSKWSWSDHGRIVYLVVAMYIHCVWRSPESHPTILSYNAGVVKIKKHHD